MMAARFSKNSFLPSNVADRLHALTLALVTGLSAVFRRGTRNRSEPLLPG